MFFRVASSCFSVSTDLTGTLRWPGIVLFQEWSPSNEYHARLSQHQPMISLLPPNANNSSTHNRERIWKLIAKRSHCCGDGLCFHFFRLSMEADQDNTVVNPTLPEHQLTKILVRRYQNGRGVVREVENRRIINSRGHFGHVKYLMAMEPEDVDNFALHALVRKKIHLVELVKG